MKVEQLETQILIKGSKEMEEQEKSRVFFFKIEDISIFVC